MASFYLNKYLQSYIALFLPSGKKGKSVAGTRYAVKDGKA